MKPWRCKLGFHKWELNEKGDDYVLYDKYWKHCLRCDHHFTSQELFFIISLKEAMKK